MPVETKCLRKASCKIVLSRSGRAGFTTRFAWYAGLLVCPGMRTKHCAVNACSHFCFSVEEVSISEGIIVTEALAIKIGVLNYEYDLATQQSN